MKRARDRSPLAGDLDRALEGLATVSAELTVELSIEEVGTVESASGGVATVSGLPGVQVDEVVRFAGGQLGVATDLRPNSVGVVMLADDQDVVAGSQVRRTGRVVSVPVGDVLLGRVLTPLGVPLDDGGPLRATARLPVERPAAPIIDRSEVSVPLHTGVKVVDALFPIGRGQRELIVGDRQTGKTSIALAAILAQRSTGVRCVYCAVGQPGAATARVVATLQREGALAHSTVVVAGGEDPPGVRQIAPFAAMSMAEAWMEAGHDVLVVFDDLTQHARTYRELALLLRRPPAREAYPGGVFYLHARLLERATQLSAARGGGSVTALPIIETQAQNMSAYIPTNLISITDGQIVLSPDLVARGVLPAVEVGLSVSRVGGRAQLPGFRTVASRLRLAHAQYEELEGFARFGADLDDATRETLTRGRLIRQVLLQGALETVPACEQVALLLAANAGLLDALPPSSVRAVEAELTSTVRGEHRDICARFTAGEVLTDDDNERLLSSARKAIKGIEAAHAATGGASTP